MEWNNLPLGIKVALESVTGLSVVTELPAHCHPFLSFARFLLLLIQVIDELTELLLNFEKLNLVLHYLLSGVLNLFKIFLSVLLAVDKCVS